MMFFKAVSILSTLVVVSLASPGNKRYGGSSFGGNFGLGLGHNSVGNGLGHGAGGVGLGLGTAGVGLGHGVGAGFGHGVGSGLGYGIGAAGVGHGVGAVGSTIGLGSSLGSSAGSATCRYWCRTPEGQAYCCERNNEPAAVYPSVKRGQCPPVRPQCPPVRFFRPPTTCSNDSKCPGAEKCCFDRCLDHHTCKLPSYY